jgi:hypothetical protein
MKDKFEISLLAVERWVEKHHYKGYDPSDGLSSYLRVLTFNSNFLERLLQQVGRQSPVNLRPLLGIKPMESTKGRGYMAWGYLARYRQTGNPIYKEKALNCLDWLDRNKSPRYGNHSWGNHFDYASRSGRMAKHESTIVWTGLIGQAFLEAYALLGIPRHLDVIKSITAWILSLPRENTKEGTCISYVMPEQSSIHNSNMIGAAFLAGAAGITGEREALEVAGRAMEYSCARQRPDGSWYYGADGKYHWVDNFHTGYNLDSLKRYIRASGDRRFDENLKKGLNYFSRTFIEENGRPKYYCKRTYPLDIQCSSQSIETLVFFSDEDPGCLELASKVASWTIDKMQDRDGHFYYRIYPFGIKAKVPLLHWGQATMYRALACLCSRLQGTVAGKRWV